MENKEKMTVEPETELNEDTEKTESEEKRILIRVPARHNPRLQQIVDRINGHRREPDQQRSEESQWE